MNKYKSALASAAIMIAVTVVYARLFTPTQLRESRSFAPVQALSQDDGSFEQVDDAQQNERNTRNADALLRVAPELAYLFPDPNDWRRSSGNIITSNSREQFFLFKGEPVIGADNQSVSLNACAFVLLPHDAEDLTHEERAQRAWVFESQDKLVITLTRQIPSLTKLKDAFDFDMITSGFMHGSVVIRSGMASPGAEDDICLRTREVAFNAKQISTRAEVSFEIGRNTGSGRGLNIDFSIPAHMDAVAPNLGEAEKIVTLATRGEIDPAMEMIDELLDDGNLGGGFSLRKIELIELTDYFRIYYDQKSLESFGVKNKNGQVASASERDVHEQAWQEEPSDFIEARSKQGLTFSFNPNQLGGWCVRFNKDVELISYRGGERTEQLLCDSLILYAVDPLAQALAQSNEMVYASMKRKGLTGRVRYLDPTILYASATAEEPLSFKFFNQNVVMTAESVQYRLGERKIILGSQTSERPVRITHRVDQNHMQGATLTEPWDDVDFAAQEIFVNLANDNTVESICARSNGSVKLKSLAKDGRFTDFQGFWQDEFYIQPSDNPNLIKLSSKGPIDFSVENLGSFHAERADFFCRYDDPKSGANANATVRRSIPIGKDALIEPHSAFFYDNVTLSSERGVATITDEAQIFFEEYDPTDARIATTENNNVLSQSQATLLNSDGAEQSQSVYEIKARKLTIKCAFKEPFSSQKPNNELILTELTLRDGMRFLVRNRLDQTVVTNIQARDAKFIRPYELDASVRLIGDQNAPARFETKNLRLVGYDVSIDRATNYFKAAGRGELDIYLTEDIVKKIGSNSQKINTSEPIHIFWTKETSFNGQTLSFVASDQRDEEVQITQGSNALYCLTAQLTLTNPVDLFELTPNRENRLDVEFIDCYGTYERPIEFVARTLAQSKSGASTEEDVDGYYYGKLYNHLRYSSRTGQAYAQDGGEFACALKRNLKSAEKTQGQTNDAQRATALGALRTGVDSDLEWIAVNMKFNDILELDFNVNEARVAKGARVVAAQTNEPRKRLDVDDEQTYPANAVKITGVNAYLKGVPITSPGANGQPREQTALEVKVAENVNFRKDDIYGACDSLSYSSQKNLVTLNGTESSKALVYRQRGSGQPREGECEYSRVTLNLTSGVFRGEDVSFGM
ncbi:MAG: hypothetical protein Q4G03_11725 [Planctomycetia bacterium]|nr:hypothetical protein [Planctomycetia bacterium]